MFLFVHDALTHELEADECVLWMDQPSPLRLCKRVIPRFLLALYITAFMVFWMWGGLVASVTMILLGEAPKTDVLLTLATSFIPTGYGIWELTILARTLEDARRTHYVLTEKRALIISEGKKKVQTILPAELDVERRELANGKGDVILRREMKREAGRTTVKEIGFFGIPNSCEVERLARELTTFSR